MTDDFFRSRLDQMIDRGHPLAVLPHRSRAIKKSEFKRVTVDTTVQEKAIAHPVDSRLLEIARRKVVAAAKRCAIALKQTFASEGKTLQRQAGGYAHAKQFKRLRRVVKRQRTILGILIREIRRKVGASSANALALASLSTWLERAERIHTQQRQSKNKLYALHAPEVQGIGKGKARKPYEFGVKVSVAVTHKQGLLVGARSFTGNPYDGHILAAQMEQSTILLQDLHVAPKQAVVDLGFRGKDVEQANPGLEIVHRRRIKTMSTFMRVFADRHYHLPRWQGILEIRILQGRLCKGVLRTTVRLPPVGAWRALQTAWTVASGKNRVLGESGRAMKP